MSWSWIRLIIYRHSKYEHDVYEKEINSLIDIVELEHHQAHQCSQENVEFTINTMKYAQKLIKKDSFPLIFPLNYLLHS